MNSNITMNRFDDIDTRAGLQAYLGNTNTFDRDLYSTFGWIEDPDEEDYYATYLRNPVAKAVVDKPAETTWRHDPEIKDGDDETETEFEQAVTRLDREHDLWNYCSRVDKLAGIGEYGILVIGFADGEDLDQPVNQEQITRIDDIAWFRVFPQISITDVTIDQDPQSDRWGEVESYDVDLSDADDADDATMVGDVEIHHSRVVHVPSTELLDDEIRGTPRQEPVFNVINDIEKVFGAASEMSYRGADYGLHIDVDPEYEFDADSLNEELQRYVNNLQNFIKTQGTSIEQIGGEVTDPSGLIDNLMGLIVAGAPYAPPKRLLMGSEQAELASSQDKANYFGRIHERQTQYGEDYIARPLLRKLIKFGVLPTPENNLFNLTWPDLFELNDIEQAEVKNKRATTLKNLAPQGNTDLIATEQKRLKFLETGDTDVLQTEQSDTQPMPAPGEETPAQQEVFNDFFLNDDWNPELHPRDDGGKFTEASGAVGNLIEGAFEAFGDEIDRETVANLSDTWVGWPTDSDTAPMWQAAEEMTFNDNDPTDITGTPMLRNQADPSDVETYSEYANHVQETLSEVADSDTITAHRFLHGEAAERLRNGETLQPRTLASWTTDENTIGKAIDEAGFDEKGNPIESEDAVVVTKEVPIENVMDHHSVNPTLNDAGQNEAVIALDSTDDLSDGEIREASEVVS